MLDNVTCARLPASELAALAGLRTVEGISILKDLDYCWVFWQDGDAPVLETVLPLDGVELFEHRGESWYRPGRQLPSFEVPSDDEAISIDRVLFPSTFEAIAPLEASPRPSKLRLVRDTRQRPSTASLCSLADLGRWAHSAPSHEIESARGAIQGDRALVLGQSLPPWPDSTRYWGDRVLIPIGFEIRPTLPEETILEALGGSGREVFRFLTNDEGNDSAVADAIPFDAFRPLTRAGIRLALRARSL